MSYTASAENLDKIRLHNRIGDDGRAANSSLKIAYAFDAVLGGEAVKRLNYEPFTLLMPVARPLYFDLGASSPAVEGPAVITAESTLALLGQKGASAPLNIVGAASIDASGQKGAVGPATISAESTLGMGGIKTILGLDKEGPAVIAASSSVGMGGVKGAIGQTFIGLDAPLVLGWQKTAVGQATIVSAAAFLAAGAIGLVNEGPATFAASIAVGMGGQKGASRGLSCDAAVDAFCGGIKGVAAMAAFLADAEFVARKGLDFLPDARVSLPSRVAMGVAVGSSVAMDIVLSRSKSSRVCTTVKLPVSTGMNLDME